MSEEQNPVAFMFWNEPDTQRHFTQLRETIGSHWSRIEPLYTAPQPALGWDEATRYLKKITDLVDDENACDPLDDAISYANKALEALRSSQSTSDAGGGVREAYSAMIEDIQNLCTEFGCLGGEHHINWIRSKLQRLSELEALSPDPHASDCEKQGEPGLNWKLSDECKKQLAEIDDNLRNAALNAGNIVVGSPSDRPADVTVEDIHQSIFKPVFNALKDTAPEIAMSTELWNGTETAARAILGTYKVGRR